MPLVEFIGESVQDSGNVAVNTSRLINFYREIVPQGGKTAHVLQTVLGQTLLDDVGAAPVRDMASTQGGNWAAGNGNLYSLSQAGTLTPVAVLPDDVETVIDGNYSDVTITADNNYYVWDGATLTEPATLTFPDVKSHFYVGGYTVLLEDGGNRFQWTNLGDAKTLDPLDFASTDKHNDILMRGFELNGSALLFGPESAELWQITGQAGSEAFAFVASWDYGLKAHNLATTFDDSLFFVGDDNNVYVGYGPNVLDITTPAINTALVNNDPTHCFFYEDRGHKFCVLRFSDRPAWVFDLKMKEWHERGEGAGQTAWRAVASVRGDAWDVGTTQGEIYGLLRTNRDLNSPLRCTAISKNAYFGDKYTVPRFELLARVGEEMLNDETEYGLALEPGFMLGVEPGFGLRLDETDGAERDAIVSLRVSRNGGRTYTAPKERSLGMKGDYQQRMTWRALGQAMQMNVRLDYNEPVNIQFNSTGVFETS